MDLPVINGQEIRIDDNGRYCLTDLWKAGGSIQSKRVQQFEKTERFDELVAILKARNPAFEPFTKTRGRYTGGSWCCKEMVYAYAIYVSAEFHLKIIDVFHAAVSGRGDIAVAIATNDALLREAIDIRDSKAAVASTQAERDEVERITNEISKKTSAAGKILAASKGKGRSHAEKLLLEINNRIQLDMFAGALK